MSGGNRFITYKAYLLFVFCSIRTVGNIIFRMDSGVGLGITHLYWWLVDGAGVAVQFVLLCFKEAAGKV